MRKARIRPTAAGGAGVAVVAVAVAAAVGIRSRAPCPTRSASRAAPRTSWTRSEDEDEDADATREVDVAAARGPRPTPFGSVWDSQLGVATSRPSPLPPPVGDDEEDFDEPEIPEYLIAEQRRGQANRGGNRPGQGGRGGGRGGARGGYNAAVERERYGRGGGGGINRYPDVGDRGNRGGSGGGSGGGGGRQQSGYGRGDRGPRQERPERAPVQRSSSSEPWSEVPEELEAMLRAQLAQSPKAASRPSAGAAPVREESQAAETAEVDATAPKRRTRKTADDRVELHRRRPRGRGSRTEAQGDDPSEDGVDG